MVKMLVRLGKYCLINYHHELVALQGIGGQRRRLVYSQLVSVAFGLEFVRLTVMSYQSWVGEHEWPWHDVFLNAINVDNTFNAFTHICFSIFLILGIYYNHLLHSVLPDPRLFRPLQEVVIDNVDIILGQCCSKLTNIGLLLFNRPGAPTITFGEKMSCWPCLATKTRLQAFRIYGVLFVLLNFTYLASGKAASWW